MKRVPITPKLSLYPKELHPLFEGADVYDSSCSREARVILIDKDGGYYLKSAPKGSLQREADMTRYFHQKGLATEVLCYLCAEQDYLLTARVPGEDCTHEDYLAQPERLCDLLATRLRALHETDPGGCPVPNHTQQYLATVHRNYAEGHYDQSLFPDNWGYTSADDAYRVVKERAHLLKCDTLLHGDYCLPNIMLTDWQFSGFIDVGNGGVADRHVDLFWGTWTLNFNLKTDRYRDRFLDAYGRDVIEPGMMDLIAACEVFG